jgi:hypothetical protein
MTKYIVTFVCDMDFEVEADNKDDAINKAIDLVNVGDECTIHDVEVEIVEE